MINTETFIHIGFPKTATSLLQEKYFPQIKEALYIGKTLTSDNQYKAFISDLSNLNASSLTSEKITQIRNYICECQKKQPIKTNKIIISDEAFAGGENDNFLTILNNIAVLKKIFNRPKLIFTFRRQDIFLEELYRQNIRSGHFSTINFFLNYSGGKFGPYYPCAKNNIDVNAPNWMGFYSLFCEILGKKNVLALPYEMLRDEPSLFFSKLENYMDVSSTSIDTNVYINQMDSYLALKILRVLNRFTNNQRNGFPLLIQNPFLPFLPPPSDTENIFIQKLRKISHKLTFRQFVKILNKLNQKEKDFISKQIKSEIINLHSSSNKELDLQLNLNLKKYGYY